MTTVVKLKGNPSGKTDRANSGNAKPAPKRKPRGSGKNAGKENEPLKIFISHKHNHAFIAKKLKDLLESKSNGLIEVYISDDIPAGTDWLKDIKSALAESDILIFLYLDETLDHSWCWVELGLFMDPGQEKQRNVLCFHPQEKPPEPLKHLQTIRTESDKIFESLKTLYAGDAYVKRPQPINATLGEDTKRLRELANKIVDLIGTEGVNSWRPPHYLTVELCTEQQVAELAATKMLPGEAAVEDYDPRTISSLFGLTPSRAYQWSNLVEKSQERGNRIWIQDFGKACAKAATGDLDVRVDSTFRAFEGGLLYRPTISLVDDYHGKAIRFHVLFTSEVKPGQISGKGRLADVFRMIHVGYRFRYEVIYPFRNKLSQLAEQEVISKIVCRLDEAIDLIVAEADELGLLTIEGLTEPFADQETKDRLGGMLKEWGELIAPNLKKAVAGEDIPALEASLGRLQEANSEFIAICGQRFSELSKEDLRSIP
jgi:hypothetical protein